MSIAVVLEREVAPRIVEDDRFYEVVDGRRVEHEPLGAPEAVMASDLASAMNQIVRPAKLGRVVGEVLFRLRTEPNLQRRPDAAFVSSARWPIDRKIPRGNAWDVVPDLAIEVVSPTNTAEEIVTKIREYFEAGVRRVWVFYLHESLVYEYDSPESIRVFERRDILDGGEVIPGFRIALSELFPGERNSEPA